MKLYRRVTLSQAPVIIQKDVDETKIQIKDNGRTDGSVEVFGGIDEETGYESWNVMYKSFEDIRKALLEQADFYIDFWNKQKTMLQSIKESDVLVR